MTESTGNERELPEDPRIRPEDTLDALEERVFGKPRHRTREEDDTDAPAFEQDAETEDPEVGSATPEEPPE